MKSAGGYGAVISLRAQALAELPRGAQALRSYLVARKRWAELACLGVGH